MPTRSSSSCARNGLICSSTAASISAHVAFGCSLRHWVIPSTSLRPALTRCICSLCMTFRHRHFRRSRLIELAEVEEGKAEAGERQTEACEEDERESREQSGPGNRLLLVPRHL